MDIPLDICLAVITGQEVAAPTKTGKCALLTCEQDDISHENLRYMNAQSVNGVGGLQEVR